MECCISVCSSAVGQVGELVVQHVHSQLEFSFFYKKRLDKLREKASQLEDSENRLKLSIQQALDNLEEIHDDVHHWMNEVNETIKGAKRIIEQPQAQGDARCGHGLFPNLKLRHRLGKDAYKWELKVVEKLENAPSSDSVSYQPELQCHIENEGYESFESRRQIFDEIRKALRNNENNIGVYGMAGIGKTMLVKEVGKQALKENLFSKVTFTAVSQKPNYERIQHEIAAKLDFSFGDKTEISQKKVLLQKKLEVRKEEVDQKNERATKEEDKKKVLIILDDIWGKLNLDVVGIPYKIGQARCKVILTSRFENILRDDMDLTQYFHVTLLSKGEAMNLFNKIVRGRAEHSDFKALAENIVEECACLPIAIHTVASALKNKSLFEWRDALTQLQGSILTDIKEMDEKVFKSIQMSYDFLKSEEAQSLLLLCCLYEEDANINVYHLLMYGLGWGLFKGISKLEDGICRIHKLIDKLRDHCLLLKGDYNWSTKVHDVVRDFGIQYAGLNRQIYCIRSDEEMETWVDEMKPENSVAISLQYDSIKSLPHRLDCPKLRLFWAWKDRTLKLEDLFFKETKELKVLDMSSLSLQHLPSSLCYLDNLQTLRLSGCKLKSVDRIGELKNLKVLDFSRSNIVNLPEEIGQLTRLQLLDLHECNKLKKIHPGVLTKLTRLEELNMKSTFIEWEATQEQGKRRNNASLNEVMGLCRLTALYLNISCEHISPKDLFNGKVLKRYDISVTYPFKKCSHDKFKKNVLFTTKRLKLNLRGIDFLEYDFGMLLESCEEIQLKGVKGAESLVPGACAKGFPQLKHLTICENAEIEYIINSVQQNDDLDCGNSFKLLETLNLICLERLAGMSHGNLACDSFNNLMDLKVNRCHKLRNLFSFSTAKLLSQLQVIEVDNCERIDKLVVHDDECFDNTVTTIFPKLRTLRLIALPVLVTFCSLELMSSKKALPLFSGQRIAPNLRELKIGGCNSVKYLFSSSLATRLSQLNQLEISSCHMLEEIIMMDHEEMGILQFPLLKHLLLGHLPKLIKFFSGPSLQFPELNEVRLFSCPLFVTFVSNSLSTNISEGNIYSSKVSLFTDELVAPNLTELRLWDCGSLTSLCSSFFAVKLVQLVHLYIEKCDNMEEIIITSDEKMAKVEFHQLKYLGLHSLPKLRRFYGDVPAQLPSSSKLIEGTNISKRSKDSSITTLFNENVIFPSLELMDMGDIDQKLNATWHNQQVAESFCQLKEVHLRSMNNVTIKNFLAIRRPLNLRRLTMYECDIGEEVSLPCLELEESSLDNDTTLRNSQLDLKISNCGFKILSWSPSTTSLWKNVTFLRVDSCDEPQNLLTYAAAQALPQLKELLISDCGNMIQVIANEGTNRGIVFGQLELLVLADLPSLTSFCSGSYILRFPKLTRLGIIRCPMMTRFSNQITDTPRLKKLSLQYHEKELYSKLPLYLKDSDRFFRSISPFFTEFDLEDSILIEGNINDTIQHLWEVEMGIALRQLFAETEDSDKQYSSEEMTDSDIKVEDSEKILKKI